MDNSPELVDPYGTHFFNIDSDNPAFAITIPLVWTLADMEQDNWEEVKQGLIINIARQYKEAIEDVERDVERRMNES